MLFIKCYGGEKIRAVKNEFHAGEDFGLDIFFIRADSGNRHIRALR